MDNIVVDTLEIDGKEFILIDTIDEYNYFIEENNPDNLCILKKTVKNGENLYVSLENDIEIDKAISMYAKKYTGQ